MKKMSIPLLMILLASPAHGMLYTWTDAGGVTHFTNKEYEIPARYRVKTKALYPEQADGAAPQQAVSTPQSVSVPQAAPVPQPPPPAQEVKSEAPVKSSTQPVIAPSPQKYPGDRAERRARRNRTRSSGDE